MSKDFHSISFTQNTNPYYITGIVYRPQKCDATLNWMIEWNERKKTKVFQLLKLKNRREEEKNVWIKDYYLKQSKEKSTTTITVIQFMENGSLKSSLL